MTIWFAISFTNLAWDQKQMNNLLIIFKLVKNAVIFKLNSVIIILLLLYYLTACNTTDQRVGDCINIKNCKLLLTLMLNPKKNASDVTYLRNSLCGYEGKDPKVCCSNANTTVINTTTQSPNNYKAGVSSRLMSECGISNVSSNRIVGGKDSDLGKIEI